MRGLNRLMFLLAVWLLSAVPASAGFSFTSAGPITIPSSGNATPYPVQIAVSGITGPVTNMQLTLNNFTHSWPDDLTVLLVDPTGTLGMVIFDGAINGNDGGILNQNYTFANGGAVWPNNSSSVQPASGTYQPISYFSGTVLPAPAPLIPGANPDVGGVYSFNSVIGGNPNGNWTLYIRDYFAGDSGSIGSIRLDIETAPAPPALYAFLSGGFALIGMRRWRKSA